MYFKRMVIRFKSEIETTQNLNTSAKAEKKELRQNTRGLSTSETRAVVNPKQFTFCGTDNGLVNMTLLFRSPSKDSNFI